MYGYIYVTTNNVNGKKYIGQHKWCEDSIDPNYLGSGIILLKAIKIYGKNNFTCEIIDTADTKEELSKKEIYYISQYCADKDDSFYNVDSGRGNTHEYNCKESTRKKLSDIQKNHRTINNGVKQLIININELDNYLLLGWTLGRLPKDYSDRTKKFKSNHYSKSKEELDAWKNALSKAICGRRWVNDGFKETLISTEDVNKYLEKGYKLGRLFARGKSKSLTTIENTSIEEKSIDGSELSRIQENSKC